MKKRKNVERESRGIENVETETRPLRGESAKGQSFKKLRGNGGAPKPSEGKETVGEWKYGCPKAARRRKLPGSNVDFASKPNASNGWKAMYADCKKRSKDCAVANLSAR